MKSVILPDTITRIDDNAFYSTGIEKIVIPSNVCEIGYQAFEYCSDLNEVILPDSLTYIGEWAFDKCNLLTEITIPRTVEKIEHAAFGTNGTGKTIYGYKDTTAQSYAQNNSFNYIELPENTVTTTQTVTTVNSSSTAPVITASTTVSTAPTNTATESGDVNDDGKIDANDATLVLVNYSLLSTGEKMQLTESQQKAADVNGDGKIDASDATMILQYYSYLSTGGDLVFKEFLKQIG